MLVYIFNIIFTSIAIESAANLITTSKIFESWRTFLSSKGGLLEYMSTCHLCTSQQLSLIICWFIPSFISTPVIGQLMTALIVGRLAYLLNIFINDIYARIPMLSLTLNHIYQDMSETIKMQSSSDINNNIDNNSN